MGEEARRRQKFFAANPTCCFCTGVTPATTLDHFPPRAIFDGRVWPEGYAFPACNQCQSRTAQDELIVAMLARIGRFDSTPEQRKQNVELMRGVHHNFPEVFLDMLTRTANDKRNWLREQGFELGPGETTAAFGMFSVTHPRIAAAVNAFAVKLFCALYYKHLGAILGPTGRIAFRWFTNANFNTIPSKLGEITPLRSDTRRQRTSLGEQFGYSYGLAEDTRNAAAFRVFFHATIALQGFVFGNPTFDFAEQGVQEVLRPFEPPS